MRKINFKPKSPKFKKVFENTGGEYGTFTGMYAAEKWLRENGFGFGSLDFPCPYILSVDKTLKAIAFKDEMRDSDVKSGDYNIIMSPLQHLILYPGHLIRLKR